MDAYPAEQRALARALDKAALALEKEAARLRVISKSHRKIAKRWETLNRHVATAPHLVDWLKSKGSNDPVSQAAERLDTPPEFIEAHYTLYQKTLSVRERRQRDREIARRAKTGQTNAHIARACGVSISTVKRVLKAADLGRYSRS